MEYEQLELDLGIDDHRRGMGIASTHRNRNWTSTRSENQMRITHRIDLGTQEISLEKLHGLYMTFSIPPEAVIGQNEDDYDLGISWYTEA